MKYPLAEERRQWIAEWIKTNGPDDGMRLQDSDKSFFDAYHQKFPMYQCRRARYEDRLVIKQALDDLREMAERGDELLPVGWYVSGAYLLTRNGSSFSL